MLNRQCCCSIEMINLKLTCDIPVRNILTIFVINMDEHGKESNTVIYLTETANNVVQ